jgi:CRISPR-associated protein Cas6
LFSRYVAAEAGEEEQQFLNRVAKELQDLGVRVRKLMCGKSHAMKTSHGELATRSLMIADLGPEDSVRLQEKGLGPGRLMGCGLFVPHKGIRPVREED